MHGKNIQIKYQQIYRQIVRKHRLLNLRQIGARTLRFLSITGAAVAAFLLINLLFDVSPVVRLTFAGLLILWSLVYSVMRIFPRVKEIFRPSVEEIFFTAKQLGMTEPSVQDALLNYLQIYQNRSSHTSPMLKNLALEQLYRRFSHFEFSLSLRAATLLRRGRLFLIELLAVLLIYLIFPETVGLALKKIVLPWKNIRTPVPVQIYNHTGNRTVLKNDPLVLAGEYRGEKPKKLFLVLEDTTGAETSSPEQTTQKITLPVPPRGKFEYRLEHVRTPFRYYFSAEINPSRFRNQVAQSTVGKVSVIERPVVRNLQLKIEPPSYTGLPEQLLTPNEGEITALAGSRVSLHVESDKQLSRAYLLFGDSTRVPLKIAGHTANGKFTVSRNTRYSIHIFDSDSIANGQPVVYNVYPIPDEAPFAEFKQPGADVDLEEELSVPLFVEMRDDYGFKGLWLKGDLIRAGSSGDTSRFRQKLPYKILQRGKAFSQINWDLTTFFMVPDDYIRYRAEVWDNDAVHGPKIFQSRVFTIRLPSLLEMLEQTDKNQEERLEDVKDIVQNSKELKKKLEELRRELKKGSRMNWEQKQEAKEQLNKQQKALDRLSELNKELENTIQKLDRNKLLSPETLEKYFELQKMIQELATPELKAAMQKLQEALEKANPEQIRQAMKQFQFSVEKFEQNVERAYELLKRVQLEQKMDELVNLSEKLTKEQQEMNRQLEKEKPTAEKAQQLGAKEKDIEKQAEYLKKEIGETNKEMQELLNQLSEMLQKAESFMEEEQMTGQMQQMQQQMQNQDFQSARKSGKQLKSKMEMLKNMLQMARKNMTNLQKEMLAKDMQKAMQEMLATSFQQEALAKQSSKISSASSQVTKIARKQAQIKENTGQLIRQLVELSNKTFFLSPQMNQLMANILRNINKSIQQLENRNVRRAAKAQRSAMAGFNQALLSLQNSMQQMAQASSASGFQEFMQQMQQMAGQQGQLNQESMSLFQKAQNGRMQLSPDDLGRLAAQQEMIHQSMEQLAQKMGNRRDVLGRLGEMGKEMEEVVKQLKAQRLDRKVIERQERILSRLLDAQKSIREKEYSKKRRAEWEKQKLVRSPAELQQDLLRKEDRLRKALMDALQEGYTPEYRELIKLYFETLSRQNPANQQ